MICAKETRRQIIREKCGNGIDYVDVKDDSLCVHFINGIPADIDENNVVIRGGRRITNVRAVAIEPHATEDPFSDPCLGIRLNRAGDRSTYTLSLVETDEGEPTNRPLCELDPRYASIDFSFKLDCPAEIDCKTDQPCPPPSRVEPEIQYLAKDYAGFRQLILDRFALIMPDWRERHAADVQMMLVEVLAYVGDHLSYEQDAVATEAYLETARLRISVHRHARLVDYAMHEGCNARTFVFLEVAKKTTLRRGDAFFLTRIDGIGSRVDAEKLPANDAVVYEPLLERDFVLHESHNRIAIYTWGDEECCLEKGATRCTLVDDGLELCAGEFLLFEELACAGTVTAEFDGTTPLPDADRTHRHVVRLTSADAGCDPLTGVKILEVTWDDDDALPFSLCISAVGKAPECDYVRGLAVARGNIVLADQGVTVVDEPLAPVPDRTPEPRCDGADDLTEIVRTAGRYRPRLKHAPVTFAEPLIPRAPASRLLQQDPRLARPAIALSAIPPDSSGTASIFGADELLDTRILVNRVKAHPDDPTVVNLLHRLPEAIAKDLPKANPDALAAALRKLLQPWTAQPDLIGSDDDDEFVAEIDDEGRAQLRFGDGDAGRAVEVGTTFLVRYRVGNGRAGLIGPDALAHVAFRANFDDAILRVRNPLPASGAVDPESVTDVKLRAPFAFRRRLQRAATAPDYQTVARSARYPLPDPRLQSSSARLEWSGSWYEADVTLDPASSLSLDPELRDAVASSIERYRRMGHDLRVGGAEYVPLLVELKVCVKPEYLTAHVVAALRAALGNRGQFAPDNLTFGQSIHVSRIVAAAQAVDGVLSVDVTGLSRFGEGPNPDFDDGLLRIGPTQIAHLDDDPAQPENGQLVIKTEGGR